MTFVKALPNKICYHFQFSGPVQRADGKRRYKRPHQSRKDDQGRDVHEYERQRAQVEEAGVKSHVAMFTIIICIMDLVYAQVTHYGER